MDNKISKFINITGLFLTVLIFASLPVFALACEQNDCSDQNATVEVVSNTEDMVVGGSNAVATYSSNSRWTASVPGATWIWKTVSVADPSVDDETSFSKTFNITSGSTIDSATLVVAADNSFTASLNGTQVGSDSTEFNYFEENKHTYNVVSNLHAGSNTISFTVKNWALASSTPETNPAGLIYKLTINTHSTSCDSDDDDDDTNPQPVDLSCKITSPDQNGWYGTYYNYKSTTLGMNLPQSQWDTSYGNPLSAGAQSAQWYTSPFTRFSRVDSSLNFGNNFFPFDSAPEETISGHDYHFGVHWAAKVTASTTGAYGFTLKSDDDSWLYVNGQLVANNSGVHSANTITATTTLTAGINTVDIFFAERHTTASFMAFSFNDNSLVIKPYSPVCPPSPGNTPPVINLIGANPFNLTVGDNFVDPGATATDTEDGNLTSSIVSTSTVNAAVAGNYQITYSVTDSGGLSASAVRAVTVKPVIVCESNCNAVNTPPSITLIGSNPINLTVDDIFVEPGATATDTEDGNLTSQIVETGSVNASTTGTYVLTYVVKDSGNLYATTTRTVTVSPVVIPPVNPPSDNGGGGGGGGGGGTQIPGGHRQDISGLLSSGGGGEVLGATSCNYLRDFLKIDWQNDKIEVLKLQSFLNVFEKENLSLTGVYDQATFDAVSRFQTKYANDILVPWGDRVAKGFTYILTRKKINEIYCNTPFPLTQQQQVEIVLFKGGQNPPDRNSAGQIVGSVNSYFGQSTSSTILDNSITGQTGQNPKGQVSNSVVVNLKPASSTSASVVRNAAISLFALPQKVFSNSKYFIIFLILLAIAVVIVRLLTSSGDNTNTQLPLMPITEEDDKKEDKKKNEKSSTEEESPTIILPGALPDEEIVMENPEEEEEEIITTPDLRDDEDEEDLKDVEEN